jgi:MFS family permease
MGLMILLGTGGGAILVAAATAFGNPRTAVFVIMAVELVTMLLTVTRVRDGRPGIPRKGRSWGRIALEAWGTDILRERSFIWLLGSRLFLLMATSTLIAMSFFFMQDTFALKRQEAVNLTAIAGILVIVFGAIATLPSGRLSQRFGRKRMIFLAAAIGFAGMAGIAMSQSPTQALVFVVLVGIGGGIFLAVDWALMTDIIPKASSGRYMGLSNVVTASSTTIAVFIGGPLIDAVNKSAGIGAGPRLELIFGVVYFIIGAFALRPVVEPPRGSRVAPPVA